ncbi:hypothetical protein DPMN_092613 [Dreissena polymorpha]|uniref:Uncharacterized protein n=1 Tax=Dreissena polymorpha TaxID=45954 RepID=A0A9D4L246_DREPO|nr:hypothetical protein DPMN_092613 [Dreissena polymorpha]
MTICPLTWKILTETSPSVPQTTFSPPLGKYSQKHHLSSTDHLLTSPGKILTETSPSVPQTTFSQKHHHLFNRPPSHRNITICSTDHLLTEASPSVTQTTFSQKHHHLFHIPPSHRNITICSTDHLLIPRDK